MNTLLAHVFSLAAIGTVGYFVFYRPVAAMLRESARKMEANLEEARKLAEAVTRGQTEIDRKVKEAGETLDRLRTAAVDLSRQEIRKTVERETHAVETEKAEIERQLAKIL
jgi:F0F1-type ATP synthase membrane subunit b/b'